MITHSSNKKLLKPGRVKVFFGIFLAICMLILGIGGFVFLKESGPEADKEAVAHAIPSVKVITAEFSNKQLYVRTQGEVKDRLSTQISMQVLGQTTMVSPKLKTGGVFEKGEVILEIERANYVSALARAESTLADAQLALEQELARAEQALRDWKKLSQGEAPDLVARKPQLASARARVTAAEAGVIKAISDLTNTTLKAPYHCRVDQSYVNFGAYINAGMRVVDVSSIDSRELRVPVSLNDVGFLNREQLVGSHVDVKANFAGEKRQWVGKVVRSEGKVDRNTRTMYLAVEVAASETQLLAELPPSGLFVDAEIKGRVMDQVIEIPRSALREDNTIMVVDIENCLQMLDVEVARTMKESVLISKGISEGARIIISAIETPIVGMQVEIDSTPNKP